MIDGVGPVPTPATGGVRRPTACAIALAWLLCLPAGAAADLRVAPYGGLVFGGSTTLYDPEDAAARRKVALGSAFYFLADRGLGVELDVSYIPGFFEQDRSVRLVERSSVTTVMGNVIVAIPSRLSRSGLRLFVLGGPGLIRARMDDVFRVAPFRSKLLGLTVGGGAEGFLTDRVGLRWDLRYFRELTGNNGGGTLGGGDTDLRFWRASMGVVIKLPS